MRLALGGDEAYGPGINLPGRCFEANNLLHGGALRRAGNRCRREQLLKNLGDAGLSTRLYARGHLPNGGVLLKGKQLADRYRPRLRNASQVVTHHVGNHQVFSLVFARRSKPVALGVICLRVRFTRHGALHGL